MDGNYSGEEIDWDTEDELEIQGMPLASCTVPASGQEPVPGNGTISWDNEDELLKEDMPLYPVAEIPSPGREPISGNGEASSSVSHPSSKLIQHFVDMGFSEALVAKTIKENGICSTVLFYYRRYASGYMFKKSLNNCAGEGSPDSVLETLLTYSALESSPQQPCANSDQSSSDYDEGFLDDLSDTDSWSGKDEIDNSLSGSEKTVLSLEKMGYTKEEVSIAMERCGPEASIAELTDFICAAQMARADDTYWQEVPDETKPKLTHMYNSNGKLKKRKLLEYELSRRKKERGLFDECNETIRLPKPMIGFGLPRELQPADELWPVTHRTLPEQALGPPFFYYENVALAPKGVWDTISRFLYDIEPEFVDSKYFCAAARKRGYIHNLPTENRFPLLPIPHLTINDALPLTKKWWPSWDTRKKLNCLQTAIGSARLTDRIRKAVEDYDGEPPLSVQKFVIEQCKKWNLVWVGRNKVAPLEPDEVEMLLGFPKNHTRGGGISRTDRYKSLGNSFQVDTVAYHLSVLKHMFPKGINVLSLFSGIGGAEVALHKLGVPLKNVVSVEKSEVNRNIVRSWWEQTNQRGNLIDFDDVRQLNGDKLEQLIASLGGFDLVIGGSPCNNLAGSNRVSRDGLEGKESSLFYDYFRILDLVRCIMGR